MNTKDRERATKEWEEKLEFFAPGSFQLSQGQWPPKGSERALLGSCRQPMNKSSMIPTSPLSYTLYSYWSHNTEVLSQNVQHLTRGVAGREEGRSKEAERFLCCVDVHGCVMLVLTCMCAQWSCPVLC